MIRHRRGLSASLALATTFCGGSTVLGTDPVVAQPKMGDVILGLTADQLNDFMVGKTAYGINLEEFEGLGPAFNKENCAGCHNNPIGGPGTSTVTRFGTSTKGGGFDPLESLGGSLLQADAINDGCREDIPGAATITQTRITNGMLGYGLVEAIPDADLLDSGQGIAAAHDAVRRRSRDGAGDTLGAMRKGFDLENTHWTVPENRFRLHRRSGIALRCPGADVDAQSVLRNRRHRLRGRIFLDALGNDMVVGQQQFTVDFSGTRQNAVGVVQAVQLDERSADGFASRCKEGVGHRAPDADRVRTFDQRAQHVKLVGHLCAAQETDEGMFGIE